MSIRGIDDLDLRRVQQQRPEPAEPPRLERRAQAPAPVTDAFEVAQAPGPTEIRPVATAAHQVLDAWRTRLTRPRDASSPPVTFDPAAPDTRNDGALVGIDAARSRDGAPVPLFFDPQRPLTSIPAFGNQQPRVIAVYTNGIATPALGQAREIDGITRLRDLALSTGAGVVGIRNSTSGSRLSDREQVLADRDLVPTIVNGQPVGGIQTFDDLARYDPTHAGRMNPAVVTLAETVIAEMRAGRPVHLMGYSQGASITAGALQVTRAFLSGTPEQTGLSRAELDTLNQRFNQIRVETFAGVARAYPPGPQYVHYINVRDFAPQDYGLLSGNPTHRDLQARAGGPTAVMQYIDSPGQADGFFDFTPAHNLAHAYLPHRTQRFGDQLPLPDSVGVQDLQSMGVSEATARELVSRYPLMDVLRPERLDARAVPGAYPNHPGLQFIASRLRTAGSQRSRQMDAIVRNMFERAAAQNPADPQQGVYDFLAQVNQWRLDDIAAGRAPRRPLPPLLNEAINRTYWTSRRQAPFD